MRKLVFVILVSSFLVFGGLVFSASPEPEDNFDTPITRTIVESIRNASVTIHAGRAQGSGEIVTRGDTSFVWSAGHVVAHLRSTRSVIDSSGSTKTIIEFDSPKVVKEVIENGRSVEKTELDAEVICFSDSENGDDLALLRIRKKNFSKSNTKFYLGEQIPHVGVNLYHCGSLLGQIGSNSFTRGIMSQHGRVLYDKVFDQTTCAAFPGSSGGGVYLSDGRMCGMIVRGAGETFNLIVPVRRIHAWAKKHNLEFALDESLPVPSETELKKIKVDCTDIGNNENLKNDLDPRDFHFLIYNRDRDVKLNFRLGLDR